MEYKIVLTKRNESCIKECLDRVYDGSYEEFLNDLFCDDQSLKGDALFCLSVIYQINGDETDDFISPLEAAADLGCVPAIEQLADLYYDFPEGGILPHNPQKAIELYKKCVSDNYSPALLKLGYYYLDNDCPERNVELGISYFEKAAGHDSYACYFIANYYESIANYDEAIKFWKRGKVYVDEDEPAEDIDEEDIMACNYDHLAYLYFLNNDHVNSLKYANKGIASNHPFSYYVKGLNYLKNENQDLAIECLKKATAKNVPEAYFELGKIYNDVSSKYLDKNSALFCFEKATELGCDCSVLVETLRNEIHPNDQSRFNVLLDSLVDANTNISAVPNIIEKDLKKDFGQNWEKISNFTRSVFVTGITSMVAYIKCEKNNQNANYAFDYSNVIISASRGLEKELKEFLYSKFRNYLELNNISPCEFKRIDGFTIIDENGNLKYSHSDNWFTLGKIKYLVNPWVQKNYRTGDRKLQIDYYLCNFCQDYLFKKNLFGASVEERRKNITKYMADFSNQVSNIAYEYRNEAAHTGSISSMQKAKSCVEWIIKVRQLLLKFIEKVDFDSISIL